MSDSQRSDAGYKAFISYKHHVSTGFARLLEQALKAYAKPLLARPIRIFRDEKHLVPGADLPKLIVDALEASEFLLLLASPESASSPWVRDEVDYWCGKLKRTQNLIVVLVGGEIATDDEAKRIDWTRTNALPKVLEGYLEHVPLYVDLRNNAHVDGLTLANPDFKTAINGITARFRGIDPNDMLGEEIHQHRRNLRLRNGAMASLGALTLVSMIAAYVAVQQRQQARQQTRIAVSRQYAAEAVNLIENDLDEAILRAVSAVNAEQTFEARSLLFQTLAHSPEIETFLYRLRKDTNERFIPSFDQTGNRFVLAIADTLQLFELSDARNPTRREVRLSTGNISSVAYNHSSSTIAVGGDDGRVSLFNTSQWTPIASPVKTSDRWVTRLFFNPTDDRLFAVSNGEVFSFSVSSNTLSLSERVRIREGPTRPAVRDQPVNPVFRFPDLTTVTADRRVLVTGSGNRVVAWDLSGPMQQQLSFVVRHRVFTTALREIAISPGGEILAVDLMAASDGIPESYVQLYSMKGLDTVDGVAFPKLLSSFTTRRYLSTNVSRLAFNNSGSQLLIGDLDATFQLIDVKPFYERIAATGQESRSDTKDETALGNSNRLSQRAETRSLTRVKGLLGDVHEPRFTPDDKRLLLGIGTRVIVWNPRPPQKLSRTLITHDRRPRSITFSEDGRMLVVAAVDGTTFRWNMLGATPTLAPEDRSVLKDKATGEGGQADLDGWRSLSRSPHGRLVAQFRAGILRVLSLPTSSEAWRTQLYDSSQIADPPIREPSVTFSKDETRMIVHVYGATKLSVWNTATGRQVTVFDTGGELAWSGWAPAASQDGQWIATARGSRSLGVINTATRDVTAVEARGSICSVAFSPNQGRLAVSYKMSEVEIGDSADGKHHPADFGVLFWNLTDKRWDVPSIKVPSPPCQIAFNPDGDRLAIATSPEDDEQVQVLVWTIEPRHWAKVALEHIMYEPLRP